MRNIRTPNSNQNKIPSTARNKYRDRYKAAAHRLVPRYQLYSFYNRNTTFCRVPKNYLSDRGLGFPVSEVNPLRSGVKTGEDFMIKKRVIENLHRTLTIETRLPVQSNVSSYPEPSEPNPHIQNATLRR